MKHIIATLAFVAGLFAASGSWAQSENLPNDVCKFRANIASQIVGQHVEHGVPLEALKGSFAAWIVSGMAGANDLLRAQMKEWYTTWTGPVFEKWFGDVYAKYDSYQVAHDAELAACRANNNAPPVD